MKITSKILHFPPYISTRWNFIQALYLKGENLVITLKDNSIVEIPALSPDTLELIFNAYAQHIEAERSAEGKRPGSGKEGVNALKDALTQFPFMPGSDISFPQGLPQSFEAGAEPILRFGFGPLDNLSGAMHHNSAQANMPDLPREILNKIAAVAKIVAPDEVQTMPKPEPHCNCTYCQIARAVHQGIAAVSEAPVQKHDQVEEEVTDADLTFQQWEIVQTGERLYSVVNRLDSHEKYSVYLGHPVGCTCGRQGCEHILAVLKS